MKTIGKFQYITTYDSEANLVWLYVVRVGTGELVSQHIFSSFAVIVEF